VAAPKTADSKVLARLEASAGATSGFALLYSAVLLEHLLVLGALLHWGLEHTCIFTMFASRSEKEMWDRHAPETEEEEAVVAISRLC
jgi:hypothetical protein